MVFNSVLLSLDFLFQKKELLILIPEKKSKLHANQALKEKKHSLRDCFKYLIGWRK